MYKVLVVEDEYLIRKGLLFSFDFNLFHASVIAEAENGKDGLLKIQNLHPDIVITDITMPFMSGLEMIEKSRNENYEAIILSGYNEFEYAKKALSLDVVHYILKPIDHEELKLAMQKAIKRLETKQALSLIKEQNNLLKDFHPSSYYSKTMVEIIEQNYAKKLQMNDCVNILNVSSSLLNRKFKEEVGTTFNEYLNRYRIQKAIEHIKNNDLPIYKIAEVCGFSDYKYFNQVFHKYLGCSPKDYLKCVGF